MTLSEQEIQDFIDAWRTDFGETLAPAAARSEALRLIDFFAWMAEEVARKQSNDAVSADAATPP